MIQLQKLIIQCILTPLAKAKKRLPESVWWAVYILSVCGICILTCLYHAGMLSRYMAAYVPFCFFFGLMIIAGLSDEITPVAFSPVLTICWFGVCVFILFSGILVEKSILADALLWLVAFPVFYLVWSSKPINQLAKLTVNGIYLGFLVFLIVNICFYPISGAAYSGMFTNTNSMSMWSTTVFLIALIDVLSLKKFSLRMFIADIILGISAALTIYTNSRAGQYVMIVCTVAGIIASVAADWHRFNKFLIHNLIPAILTIAILIPNCVYILSARSIITSIFTNENTNTQLSDFEPQPSTDSLSGIDTQSIWDEIVDHNEDRLSIDGDGNINSFTTGRVALWKIYLKEVRFLGNPASKVLYDSNGNPEGRSSHCTLIQMAYEYGILAAVFFFLFNIISGIKAVAFVYKNKASGYSLFPLLITIAYGGYYLVEKIVSPPIHILLTLYLLAQTVLIVKGKNSAEVCKQV